MTQEEHIDCNLKADLRGGGKRCRWCMRVGECSFADRDRGVENSDKVRV